MERTSAAGKASSVQFIHFHFPFTDQQVAAFRQAGTAGGAMGGATGGAEIVAGFTDPEYAHMAVLPEPVRQALAEDFD